MEILQQLRRKVQFLKSGLSYYKFVERRIIEKYS